MTSTVKWAKLDGAICAHSLCGSAARQRYVIDGKLQPVCKSHLSRLHHGNALEQPQDFETHTAWWCRLCAKYRPPSEFAPRDSGGTGKSLRRYECLSCARIAWLDAYYRKTYGISVAEYDALLERQAGKCPGCLAAPGAQRLFVDHDHTTGAVRGLLCSACNLGIGNLGDSAATLRRLADYIDTTTKGAA